jgi:hypothetical protein
MRFLILRLLTHSELGMFHEYRRQGKEGSKQRAVNFDAGIVDRVFPAARDTDRIDLVLRYQSDAGVAKKQQWLKRQHKNWRFEGNCPKDRFYEFVEPGCLFALEVDSGSRPATGAWAVFPARDAVTSAVLAEGECRDLAGEPMVALHDEEGSRVWRILSRARPDLFALAPAAAAGEPPPSTYGREPMELAPNPARLVQILRSVGHTLPSAVADLIDNAISADATRVDVTFGRPDGGHGRWLTIADNGTGMTAGELSEAMRIGSETDYEKNSLGKYGYGLKGASWSQAKVFTVVTRRSGSAPRHLTWDVDDMEGWKAKSEPLEPWENEAVRLGAHGTVVLWKEMTPPRSGPAVRGLDPFSAEVMALERHLALVFHRFIEGSAKGRKAVKITINGNEVAANNPVGHPLVSAYDAKTIRVPTAKKDGKVRAQAFLLPTEEEIDAYHKGEGAEAARRARDLIGLHGRRNETQGLFIYRHDRLIKWGGWHQMWATSDEKTKLARLTVDFDEVLDDAFEVNISKQSVHLPPYLQDEIKKLAAIARADSQKKYRKGSSKTGTSTTPASGPRQGPHADGGPGAGGSSRAPQAPAPADGRASADPSVSRAGISLRMVQTSKFVWKVSKTMTGAVEVQVSAVNPHLQQLAAQIGSDPHALSHFAAFLEDLEAAGVQDRLMTGKNGTA